MAQDPYGNEIVDPFDQAIAQGVMKSTWQSAILSAVFAVLSGCCFGIGTALSPNVAAILVGLISVLALTAAANVLVRVVTMQPEHRRLVASWQPWGALGVAVVAGCIAGIQLLLVVGGFMLQAMTGA